MKTTLKRTIAAVIALLILCSLGIVLRAQTDTGNTDNSLQPLAPADIPDSGAFFRLSDYLANGGSLGVPWPFLMDTNAAVYSLNSGSFLVDDSALTNDNDLASALSLLAQPQDQFSVRMMSANSLDPGDTNNVGGGTNSPPLFSFTPINTNGLWIEVPTNSLATSGQFAIVLHNTIEDAPYDILTTTNLSLPLSNWTIEESVLGSSGDFTPVQLVLNGYPNLFVYARFGGSSSEGDLPDWWQLKYFGTNGVNPYEQDPSGDGWTYVQDYQNGFIPGTWHTPTAPELTLNYNVESGVVVVNWPPSSGDVTGYTIEKYDGLTDTTTDTDLSPSVVSFTDTAPSEPTFPAIYGQTKYVSYKVKAKYGTTDSGWGKEALLQQNLGTQNGDFMANLPVQFVAGPGNSTYLMVSSLPSGATTLELMRVDSFADNNYGDSSFDATLDIPISASSNGVYRLPDDLTVVPADSYGNKDYEWFVSIINGTNGATAASAISAPSLANSSGTMTWASPPFWDGRQQLQQNLSFLLRAAPNGYQFAYAERITPIFDVTHRSPASYAYSGFYSARDNDNCLDLSLRDIFLPFEENYLYRNFTYSEPDLAPNGVLTTGVESIPSLWPICNDFGNSYSAPGIDPPYAFVFPAPTSVVPISAVLDPTTDARWTYFIPFQTSVGMDMIDVTSGGGRFWMTNNTRNWFGLPYASAKFAYNPGTGLQVSDLDAGGNIPAVDGYVYAEAAQPSLQTEDYYFAQVGRDLIPGNGAFSSTNTTPPVFAVGLGQTISLAGYAKQLLNNSSYSGVYGYLGQYFEHAYIVDSNGVTANEAGLLSAYGDFFATNVGPAALITMTNLGENIRGTAIVDVVKVQLDVNHDGVMDLSFGGPDNTSAASPFVFWVNNDFDRTHSVDCPLNCDSEEDDLETEGSPGTVGKNTPDCEYQWASFAYAIPSKRDLEDYTRLWLPGIKALYEAHPNLTFELSIRTNDTTDGPSMNLYLATESDGGTGYLTNTSIADQQISFPSAKSLGRLAPNTPIVLNNYFNILLPSGTGAEKFIWCGASRGKGELVLKIKDGTNLIAETSAWIQLKDIKEMYERWTVGDTSYQPPMATATNAVEDLPEGVSPFHYGIPDSTNTPYILLVHGWNMQRWEKDRFAETAFKRLYWQGYQGCFGFFRWPTFYSFPAGEFSAQSFDVNNYNESELSAWRSGQPLHKLLIQLNKIYSGNVHIMAHSMGNIVVGEALRTNTPLVHTYVAMQAAVPSHCYDPFAATRTIPFGLESGTPNRYAEYWTDGAPSYFDGVAGAETYVNFYNTNDFALDAWQVNQNLKPAVTLGYFFDLNNSIFYSVSGNDVTDLNFPQDTYEIFSLCDEARCFALGAQSDVGGVFSGSQVDLQTIWPVDTHPGLNYSAHVWHSAQFRSTNMKQQAFWSTILGPLGFDLK